MARIELAGVTKRFGAVEAVAALDLVIEDATFTALLGPSGCGKSTTMNMISGLERPTSGEIRFDGRRVDDVDPGRRNVGFVFQSYAIFTHMTAYENIAFGLRVRGATKQAIDEAVQRTARLLDIEHLLGERATRLSVNDLQKVAIGRSMIVEPDIFLLDEPFSNLDAAFRTYMRAELKSLQRRLGQTMIYVTHDQVEAMSMAERIAIMSEGRLQQYGSPDDVYNAPVNRFVAEFVGSTTMNFLPVEATASGDALALRAGLPEAGALRVAARPLGGGALTLGVRPEHLLLTDPAHDADWRGEVVLVEPLGPRTIVHVRAGDQRFRIVAPPTVRPTVGENVGARVASERVHLFDDATGAALRPAGVTA